MELPSKKITYVKIKVEEIRSSISKININNYTVKEIGSSIDYEIAMEKTVENNSLVNNIKNSFDKPIHNVDNIIHNKFDEKDLLNNPLKLSFMNNLLRQYQFSEEFLIKTVLYYDSWKCIRTQNNLSPYFCFRYLYDNDSDSGDDWTDFSEIYKYLLKRKWGSYPHFLSTF